MLTDKIIPGCHSPQLVSCQACTFEIFHCQFFMMAGFDFPVVAAYDKICSHIFGGESFYFCGTIFIFFYDWG